MRKKIRKKTKLRLTIGFIFFGIVISTLGYTFLNYLKEIDKIEKEKKELVLKIEELNDIEDSLKTDILKLGDPTYIARYAREKYLLSKDGEYIIRIPD